MNQGRGPREDQPGADLPRSGRAHHPPRRSSCILSDLFDEVAGPFWPGLQHLRYNRHEVVVFHVLDAAELDFPFQEATLFRGLEQYPELLTDPRSLRRGYLEEMQAFIAELQHGCRGQNIDYVQLRTDTNLAVALSSYLAHRLARTK